MISVNSISNARSALRLLVPTQEASSIAVRTAVGARPITVSSVGPVISDALLQIADLASRLNADSASVRYEAQLEGRAFEDKVMDWLSQIYQDDEGFQKARADGTLTIQRAVDVDELGYRSYIADLEKDGYHLGSVGAVTANQNYLDTLNASGNKYAVGTAQGQDYYVTW